MAVSIDVSSLPDLIIETIALWCTDGTLARFSRTCKRVRAICESEQTRRPPLTKPLPGVAEWMANAAEGSLPIAKVMLLGGTSGKTALRRRITEGTFESCEFYTIGIDFHRYDTTAYDKGVTIQIWDVASGELFGPTYLAYCKNAVLVMLTVDVLSTQSLRDARKWYKAILELKDEKMRFVMVACRIDLGWESAEFRRECWFFCRENRMPMLECSAKTGDGIDRLTKAMATEALNGIFARVGGEQPAVSQLIVKQGGGNAPKDARPTKSPCIIS